MVEINRYSLHSGVTLSGQSKGTLVKNVGGGKSEGEGEGEEDGESVMWLPSARLVCECPVIRPWP